MKLDNVSDIYPLTPTQEGMLLQSISRPENGAYLCQVIVSLEGEVSPARLRDSFAEVASRHDVLRSAFIWDGVDKPLQVVRQQVQYEFTDESTTDGDALGQLALAKVAENETRPFTLEQAPLIRAHLILGPKQSSRLVVCAHHLVTDGWGMHVLLRELVDHYQGQAPATPAFRYRDYVEYLLQKTTSDDNAFWRTYLADFTEPNQLRTPVSANGSGTFLEHQTCVDEGTTSALTRLTRELGVTMNTVMLSAWAIVLGRYSLSHDVVFGTTNAGRPPHLDGIEQAIGSFINTLPFRAKLNPQQKLSDWWLQLQSEQTALKNWEHSSLATVQKAASIAPGDKLFETILVFENYPSPSGAAATGLVTTSFEHHEHSEFPFALLVLPGDRLKFVAIHDQSRFSSQIVEQILEELRELLSGFVRAPHGAVGDHLSMPEKQLARLASLGNAGVEAKLAKVSPRRMDEWIDEVAGASPERLAAICGNQQLTYGELQASASELANRLLQQGGHEARLVGLYCERSIEFVVGMLATLKAGMAYVPLDPSYPRQHLDHVLQDANIQLLLTSRECECCAPAGEHDVVIIDEAADRQLPVRKQTRGEVSDDAYVIYTSGSTGRPKGVPITHRNLFHSTMARFEHYATPPGAFLLMSPTAFDSSVAGIYWTLTAGGTLVLPPAGAEQEMHRLTQLISQHQVSHLLCLPSLYDVLNESATEAELRSLRVAIVAGERLPEKVVANHFRRRSNVELHNEYGPTEGTVWASVSQLTPRTNNRISIGRPVQSTGIFLGQRSPTNSVRAVPLGCAGEIFLHGPSLTAGYLKREQETESRFHSVRDYDGCEKRMYATGDVAYFSEAGELVFLGRDDRQVKIRGHRIELGEVEHAMSQVAGVADATVTANHRGRHSLTGYYTGSISVEALRLALASRLPEHMRPAHLVAIEALPRLPNGKVDSAALPAAMEISSKPSVAPQTEIQTTLSQIWADVLGLPEVGIRDDFFELGGDSILTIQIISRARRAGIVIAPKDFAQFPTVEALCEAITTRTTDELPESVGAGNKLRLSPIQAWFFEQPHPAPHHWNHSALFELMPDYEEPALAKALDFVLANHPQLHARFARNDNDQWQVVPGTPPDRVELQSYSVDLTDADAVEAICQRVQTSLDPQHGPLFRVARLADDDPTRPDRMLIAAHHLVMDAVSYRILIDDVQFVYDTYARGDAPVPIAPDHEYAVWLEEQYRQANSEERRSEIPLWQQMLKPVANLNTSLTPEVEIDKAEFTIAPSITARLRFDANDAYHTQFYDLVIAGVAIGISRWTGSPNAAMMFESHGRQSDDAVSRAVGWLTAMYPFSIDLAGDLDRDIRGVKEALRAIPDHGIGFGQLRYLSSQGKSELGSYGAPQVLFNYLGVTTTPTQQPLLRMIGHAHGTSRDAANVRQFPLELNAAVEAGALVIRCEFSRTLYSTDDVTRLGQQLETALSQVAEHCARREATFTTSDFPQSGLSQDELDDFLSDFD